MPDGEVSDAQIAAMSAAERRELIHRLERPLDELLAESELVRVRRVRLVLMMGAIVGLIPWTVYLAIALPDKYIAHKWPATWVGFDVLLLLFLGATAVLGLLRRQLLVLTALNRHPAGLRRVVRHHDRRAQRQMAVGLDGRRG